MWPDSPYAVSVGSFRRPVPLVTVDPDLNPDVTVCFRREWLPYIVGALQQLLLQSTWRTDDPDALNLAQARAQLLIALFVEGCPPELAIEIPGLEFDGEELMPSLCESLRFHDGKLQAWCCGDWVNIDGQPSQGVDGPGQPGGGTPQPGIGECQTYHASFAGNTQWLVPTLVNAGDVLTFSNAKGAAPDGGISGLWYCPNGQTFFAGACVGVPGPHAGDFDTSIAHMRLIAIVNGVAYPADTGTLTIPGGVTNAQVVIQANDTSISDNSGSYTLDIEVCNNAVASWSHRLDLKLSNYGFVPTDAGVWTPGSGLMSNQVDGSPNNGQELFAVLDFGQDVNLTHIKVIFATVAGSHGGTLFEEIGTFDAGGTYTGRAALVPPTSGIDQSLEYNGAITVRKIKLSTVLDVRPAPGATDGSQTVYTLELSGTGYDPFA